MAWLPMANILHHKLRSALSALGIGIGVCMLVTLAGLSRGSLDEVADRWEAVNADLIVYPAGWGENITTLSGIGLSDRYAGKILAEFPDLVHQAAPVFCWQVRLAGQDHLAVGVDPAQWPMLAGGKKLRAGRLFDPDGRFAEWIQRTLLTAAQGADDEPIEIARSDLSDPRHNGLEIVIDSRLAAAGHFRLGQTVSFSNHDWTIVGIAPDGVMARVFMPRRTAQFLFGSGSITRSTLIFLKLRAGVDGDEAARRIKHLGPDVVQLRQYRDLLRQKFGIMFVYVDAVNAVALTIAFLFIMIVLYTMVLQSTREIAILKSCGASNAFVVRQVLMESLLLTAAGVAAGLVMSLLAAWAIQEFGPLLTVTITWPWVATAVAAALAGALLSALYPAWRATRVDMVDVLTLE